MQKKNSEGKMPLSDTICEYLRNCILSGELKPGERLMEIHFAKKLGVSRTPFREAIRKLEREGLVTILPRCGAHVKMLSKKDIEEVLEIRGALDALASSLAIRRITPEDVAHLEQLVEKFEQCIQENDVGGQVRCDVEFHEYIYSKCGNQRLIQIYAGLKDQIYRYRVLYLKENSDVTYIAKEHRMILEAIQNKDTDSTKEISELHIENQKKQMLENAER